jgi:hypothetical protein
MRVLHSATRSLVGAVLFGLAVAGCGGDSTAPDAPFSPSGTSADMDGMSSAFDSQVLLSYSASSAQIGALVGGSMGPMVSAVPKVSLLRNRTGATQFAASVARSYVKSAAGGVKPSFSSAAIPPEYLGVTFVYDVSTHTYVQSDLSGAPSNGVRFLLYATNPVTGTIVEPLNQIGYADVISTETSFQVRLVSGGVTYLDYTAAGSATTSAVTISITGYATNGTDRVNFDLDNHISGIAGQSMTLGVDYTLSVPTRGGFRVEMSGNFVLTDTQTVATLDLTARGEHGTVRITGSDTNGVGTYEVFVNGDLYATIALNGGLPVITGASGAQLTEEEQATLRGIFVVFILGGDFFENLIDPLSGI